MLYSKKFLFTKFFKKIPMSLFLQAFSLIIVVVFSVLFKDLKELTQNIVLFKKESTKLVIGILSSRQNFLNRKIGRETWLKEYLLSNSDFVKMWFILGNSSCDIPPDYRLNQYSCEKWNLNASGLKENFYTLRETQIENCSSGKKELIFQGFTFKVNHPLVVRKLGILSHVFMKNTDAKVAIMDIQSKEIIVQATIYGNSSSSINGYLYVPVENILFPKDYEGLIVFEGYMLHSVCSSLIWDDGGGVITFKKIYSSPFHHDSMPYNSKVFSVVSIGFLVHNIENLKEIIRDEAAITNEWNLHLQEIQKKVDFESSQHKDLLIMDLVDTYRNLPVKLLKFYKWLNLNKKFHYVLKTDDDSVVNTELIMKKLEESKFKPNKFWIWSRFRKDWPVNLVGKWADDAYKASHYPSFPCGAAYILSKQVVEWFIINLDSLYPYQGEDVSHGIWLSAINPDLIDDKYFECDSKCNKNSYNRAQLQPDQIKKVWSIFKKCNNLCECDDL